MEREKTTKPPVKNVCPICTVGEANSKHHVIPAARGGKEKIEICRPCHQKIHSLFTNKQLEKQYNTIEKLIEQSEIQNWIKWRQKHPDMEVSSKASKNRKKYSIYA